MDIECPKCAKFLESLRLRRSASGLNCLVANYFLVSDILQNLFKFALSKSKTSVDVSARSALVKGVNQVHLVGELKTLAKTLPVVLQNIR